MTLAHATGGVVVVSYNRPTKHNAFDAAISRALIAVLLLLDEDEAASGVVIAGRGTSFCAAAKFDEMLRPTHPSLVSSSICAGSMEIFAAFIEFSKPIVAAINGPAFGGGVTQATLCDGALSAEQAKFSLPFVSWSVSPEGCCSVHMVRVVGRETTGRLLVDAWIPQASAAKAIGLVS